MTQRLLELAKQARLKGDSENSLSPAEQRFAELIVQECCDMVDNNNHNSGDEWDKALGSVINSIKEHFGVK